MIDGLKLVMSGTDLRERIERRIAWHQARVDHYQAELKRTTDEETEECPLLPEHILENGRDEHLDRIDELTLIRDHIITIERYQLGEADLRFADLIERPDAPFQPAPMPPAGLSPDLVRLLLEERRGHQ
jgi:hypothetical protein